MPIPVGPLPQAAPAAGLPAHYLRPLTAQRRRETIDPVDGSEISGWDTIEFTGRIARGSTRQEDDLARQAGVVEVKLLTNFDGLRTEDRIIDRDLAADPGPWQPAPAWELDGDPWPVYGATGIHHYEARLRRVSG